ncbi:MAG: DMT family transporter [Chloroflexota bacterium]
MVEFLIVIFIGIVGGVAVGTQSTLSGKMSQQVGGAASSFIIHISGAIFSAILLLVRGGEQIQNWRNLSWLMLGSGIFGVILYLTLSQTIPRLGATSAIVLIIIGQLLMGLAIDQFGLFNVSVRTIDSSRLLATVLLIAGGYLMVR